MKNIFLKQYLMVIYVENLFVTQAEHSVKIPVKGWGKGVKHRCQTYTWALNSLVHTQP